MAVLTPVLARDPAILTSRRPSGVLRSALGLWRTRIGLTLVIVLGGIALFGPLIAPHGPADFVGIPNTGPSAAARFGTDHIGQDVWSRFLDGGVEILTLAALATLLGLVLGSTLGMLAAYSRGLADDVIMRGMDVILAFPQIMLALVVIATVGPKAWLMVAAVGLTTMPRVARVTRGAAQPVVEREPEPVGRPGWMPCPESGHDTPRWLEDGSFLWTNQGKRGERLEHREKTGALKRALVSEIQVPLI